MTQAVHNYLDLMKSLGLSRAEVRAAKALFADVSGFLPLLLSDTGSSEEKEQLIRQCVPESLVPLFVLMLEKRGLSLAEAVLDAWLLEDAKASSLLEATLRYVTKPTASQLEGIEQFLKQETGKARVSFKFLPDQSLGNGFILLAEGKVYDWSAKGRLLQLQEHLTRAREKSAGRQGIIDILKDGISTFKLDTQDKGQVIFAGDGIVRVTGIDQAAYGEVVVFDNGVRGMVQDIQSDSIGCILFGKEGQIREGSHVIRTGRQAGIPVGEEFLGRIINALGAPIDGAGELFAADYRPIEHEAPGIIRRKSVNVPLETGILSVDSMFPIGRGQRELIIGDRQTGKTTLALDAILNQKGKGIICIYAAIGQKASTVAKIVNTLKKNGAMDYSIVLSATASEPAPLQYIAPYSATALAEYFMDRGKDVLIVYDDLSKHAVAYRALSLLLERSPGREAYPGDVFYLHSRLLERSCRLDEAYGGGSITALPIIETQAGDVSAYIPTNVISITDGQIFLESDLFFAGMRPAVNVGLSVSRVGGAAQTKAMKKAAGSIRIDLAQYREMEVFTQFSSDLDELTKKQLRYGKGLMELLKQPSGQPLALDEQVISLWAAANQVMLPIEPKHLKTFQAKLLEHMKTNYPKIGQEILKEKVLSDDAAAKIISAAAAFAAQFNQRTGEADGHGERD